MVIPSIDVSSWPPNKAAAPDDTRNLQIPGRDTVFRARAAGERRNVRPREFGIRHLSVIALFMAPRWKVEVDSIIVAPGVSLSAFNGSQIEQLYQRLCEGHGIDDGEPFSYDMFVRFESDESASRSLNFGDPYSLVDRFANLIAVCTGEPPVYCRVIWSSDDFETITGSAVLHSSCGQNEFLTRGHSEITSSVANGLSVAWATQQELWDRTKATGRVVNAFTYFYYAWRSLYADQICLNLAIVLEILFAPHSQTETTHQISFNVAWFSGVSPSDRERLYRFTKKFYSARSNVVHGGARYDEGLIKAITEAFPIVAAILRTVLLEPGTAEQFENEKMRRELLDSYLFQ